MLKWRWTRSRSVFYDDARLRQQALIRYVTGCRGLVGVAATARRRGRGTWGAEL